MTEAKCQAITKRGGPCQIVPEPFRGNWCHLHDPNGAWRTQHPTAIVRTAEVALTKNEEPMLALQNTVAVRDIFDLVTERDRYREALEHVRPDHFIVFATRCRCGFDNCPVIAALDGEG